ncbi:terminase small subunit [Chromobacterium haemolyticum]|uniref:terminase small subunit n=1 Tax=Chromobacterium haemolyticum TaxID=394935 RepID=UPI0005946DA0|nr:terminase small subunit [Chromobacterium haemolyticum]MDH0342845.1 terminase small subunit [Chromobacterium haemolyticum]
MALTPRKRAFADAVLAGKSNKDAAIAAGYSEKTASAAGSRLVKDPDVAEYLGKCRKAAESGAPPPASAPSFDLGKALQHSDPLVFLKAAMNDPELEPRLRIDAAKAMLPFTHKKLGEGGKKEEKQDAAQKVGGRFSAPPPPPLKIVGK